jgi:mRNA-degrading endonuclease YafQ of YafQ-DinJ toxin-antitoxin module
VSAIKIDRFEFTKKFEKAFTGLTRSEQGRVKAALTAAAADLNTPSLRRHGLKGARAGTVSLNAGGDLRILCRIYDDDNQTVALLLIVGTHSKLYG